MYKSHICDTKPTISLKRSSLEPNLLQTVYRNSCMAYRLVTNLVTQLPNCQNLQPLIGNRSRWELSWQ